MRPSSRSKEHCGPDVGAAARHRWDRGREGDRPPATGHAVDGRDHSSHGDLSQGRPGHAIDLSHEPTGAGGGAGGLGCLGRLPEASLHRPVQGGSP